MSGVNRSALGRPIGEPLLARARRLEGEDEAIARTALARSRPVLQGLIVPFLHRAMHRRTVHYELVPVGTAITP